MFRQFINDLNGKEIYMLFSLFIFLVFFIVATIVLIRMKKSHVDYMSDIPFTSESENQP
ncbi:MAG: hypothetical protein IE931_14495 [Sphingobacteriales bacterium]|nr:hypothetical protein [Sphingobacteriales bacterium]